ncbi:MAG: DNA (cytosine-5-)-methyltransferase [Alloprevotella sp.]|nr:DNA (cytosine-5-)-methyltransferase [Alloprevotella sp.]
MQEDFQSTLYSYNLLDVVRRGITNKGKSVPEEENLLVDGVALSFNEQVAVVTHYFSLANDSEKQSTYARPAKDILDYWEKSITDLADNDAGGNVARESLFDSLSFENLVRAPFPAPTSPSFTFIDLFAGIGGFRLAMQDCGGQCIYSSEWDSNAQQTYYYNFGEIPFGDITREFNKQLIPDGFDILCAGFPCQAFSVAGYRRGFEDTRGTLFFDVAEIIRRRRPKAVYLENVKNLYTHDGGRTFQIIKSTLEELGYAVFHKVMNATEYANIPQNRERIFIVCFDPLQVPRYKDFVFPEREPLVRTIHDCIDYQTKTPRLFYDERVGHIEEIRAGVVSKDTIYQWRRQYVRENKSKVCPTLTANMGTGGHNVPLILTDDGIRKLSPKECLNFQGFPPEYEFPSSISEAAKYKQAGNSVVVPLIRKVCQNIISVISKIS